MLAALVLVWLVVDIWVVAALCVHSEALGVQLSLLTDSVVDWVYRQMSRYDACVVTLH